MNNFVNSLDIGEKQGEECIKTANENQEPSQTSLPSSRIKVR